MTEDESEDRVRTRLTDAALEAEYATGERERTLEEAKRHIVVRLVLIVVGSIITLAGLAALVLPGPGLVLILIGLGILAQEVPWAERLLTYARRKARLEDVKSKPLWVRIVLWVFTILGIAAGVVFTIVTF